MIKELTPEQIAKFPEYIEKWIAIGTNTDRLKFDDTKEIVDNFRKLIGLEVVPMVIMKNPIESWVACCLFELGVTMENIHIEVASVFNGNPKKYVIPPAILPYQTGSFFAHLFSFYDYLLTEVGIKFTDELLAKYKNWEKTSQIGCIYPLTTVTVISEKPSFISLNEKKVLHCETGPALKYEGLGDFTIYALNGISLPDWIVTTPAEQLTLEMYQKLTNADEKAEFVRKIGIERFIESGNSVDSYKKYPKKSHKWWHSSEYELVDMKAMFPTLDFAPYLKMLNQTTKIWHMEAVSPECRTIEAALKERFGGKDFIIEQIA